MDRLGIAAERLTKALNALEEGLVPLDRTRDDAADLRAQLAETRAKLDAADKERDRLLARVAELEEEQQAALTAPSAKSAPRSAARRKRRCLS
jgi:predicted nuclease with TOPRIM domain